MQLLSLLYMYVKQSFPDNNKTSCGGPAEFTRRTSLKGSAACYLLLFFSCVCVCVCVYVFI